MKSQAGRIAHCFVPSRVKPTCPAASRRTPAQQLLPWTPAHLTGGCTASLQTFFGFGADRTTQPNSDLGLQPSRAGASEPMCDACSHARTATAVQGSCREPHACMRDKINSSWRCLRLYSVALWPVTGCGEGQACFALRGPRTPDPAFREDASGVMVCALSAACQHLLLRNQKAPGLQASAQSK